MNIGFLPCAHCYLIAYFVLLCSMGRWIYQKSITDDHNRFNGKRIKTLKQFIKIRYCINEGYPQKSTRKEYMSVLNFITLSHVFAIITHLFYSHLMMRTILSESYKWYYYAALITSIYTGNWCFISFWNLFSWRRWRRRRNLSLLKMVTRFLFVSIRVTCSR